MGDYYDAVMALSPTAYWRMGEASGMAFDDETTNHDGVWASTPTQGVASLLAGEPANTCVNLTEGPYGTVTASSDFYLDNDYSFIFWVKWNAVVSGAFEVILMQYVASPLQGWAYGVGTDHKQWVWTAATNAYGAGTTIDNGNIHMGAVTVDFTDVTHATIQFYLDGNTDGSATTNVTMQSAPNHALYVGRHTAGSYLLNAKLDEVTMFNGIVLTPTQIADLYELGNTAPTQPASVVAWI